MASLGEMNIDFYTKHEASVRLIFPEIKENIYFYEVALFTMYLLRQMGNLNGSGVDAAIALGLRLLNPYRLSSFNLGDHIHASDIDVKTPLLLEYRGKGEKSFEAIFNIPKGIDIPVIQIQLRGFGIFGKEINYYSLQSVNILIHYFAEKYAGDITMMLAFGKAANMCASEYIKGSCNSVESQGNAAIRILKELFPKEA